MTHHPLKVGDLAICVNTDLPENAGLIVEVLAIHVHSESWGAASGPLCRVRTAGTRPLHFVVNREGERGRRMVREGTVPASRLRPITPPEGALDEEKDELQHC